MKSCQKKERCVESSCWTFYHYFCLTFFLTQVINELEIKDLSREDLHTIFTCQASNNNISVPVSTSVKLDMQCESLW